MSKRGVALSVTQQWQVELDRWETLMKVAGQAPTTIKTRLRHVRQLARGVGTDSPDRVTEDMLFTWVGEQKWEPETRHAYYVSIRKFFESRKQASPASNLPKVRRPKKKMKPAPEKIVHQALQDASNKRSEMIFLLAAEAGLRADEISRVHLRDIVQDLTGWSLHVVGKGSRERFVPLSTGFALELTDWCKQQGGWAFPGNVEGHLSARWVGKLAARDIPGLWRLHSFRRRFATQSYRKSKNIRAVQELLGHGSIETTELYVDIDDRELRHAAEGARLAMIDTRSEWPITIGSVDLVLKLDPLCVEINGVTHDMSFQELADLTTTVLAVYELYQETKIPGESGMKPLEEIHA